VAELAKDNNYSRVLQRQSAAVREESLFIVQPPPAVPGRCIAAQSLRGCRMQRDKTRLLELGAFYSQNAAFQVNLSAHQLQGLRDAQPCRSQ
jgi:hypothetical protein